MDSNLHDETKRTGAHYTPASLAKFLATRLAAHRRPTSGSDTEPVSVFDPACGDGALLEAFIRHASTPDAEPLAVRGMDTDEQAVDEARRRLQDFDQLQRSIQVGDFLELIISDQPPTADIIVANPPYVRTQVLGADRAQSLAQTFGLKGRLDLYQAFLVAMTTMLTDGGLLGVITSNRLLTTRGAGAVREFLLEHLEILELVDLGDTRLFDAAVLPAVLIGRKRTDRRRRDGTELLEGHFVRVYEAESTAPNVELLKTHQQLFSVNASGHYRVDDQEFAVTTGALRLPERSGDPWAILSAEQSRWLHRVDDGAAGRLGELCKVRVGIKTNADAVFIRDDWSQLPPDQRPEDALLFPLVTNDAAARWSPSTPPGDLPQVLYPHRGDDDGGCRPVDLDRYPAARRYLQQHESRLRDRTYLLDAGRRWFEHWVPHRPALWTTPKIVFPDISTEMVAFCDADCIVKGNCYWLCPDEELLYRLLGLLNSSTIARYHDLAFQNRLYGGRRRYLTQYVKNYPVPPLNEAPMDRVDHLVRRLVYDAPGADEIARLESDIDEAVRVAFGV